MNSAPAWLSTSIVPRSHATRRAPVSPPSSGGLGDAERLALGLADGDHLREILGRVLVRALLPLQVVQVPRKHVDVFGTGVVVRQLRLAPGSRVHPMRINVACRLGLPASSASRTSRCHVVR
jgi:hypothetical protein